MEEGPHSIICILITKLTLAIQHFQGSYIAQSNKTTAHLHSSEKANKIQKTTVLDLA
jgi:hypothetical protein